MDAQSLLTNLKFRDTLPGDIGITALGGCSGEGCAVLARLYAGSSYTPGTHPYPVTVTVLKGTGLFFLGGSVITYGPKSMFIVYADTLHSFKRVNTVTVFIKTATDMADGRARARARRGHM